MNKKLLALAIVTLFATAAFAAPDAAAIEQNDMLEMVVDPKATHQDYFLHSSLYDLSSRQAIIAALDKFLK